MPGKKFYFFISGISVAGIVWLILNHYFSTAIPVCIFRKITGIPCPSCGITGTIESFFGNYDHFMFFNPLGIIVFPVIIIVPLWITADLLSGKESFLSVYRKGENLLRQKRVAIPIIILVLLIWAVNICQYVNLL